MAGFRGACLHLGTLPPYVKRGASARKCELKNMNLNTHDFSKALDGVIAARTREATRQIGRSNEFQLIGAITKRPN